jgi:uncharacterized damage-inducible protein DinB
MHPRTEELLHHLDETRAALRAAVDAVPSSLRDARSAPDRWSVAEVLEHLARVEEGITRLLASKLTEARTTGALEPDRETSSVVGLIDRDLILDRSRRITAGERVLPKGEMTSAAALDALDTSRAKLRDLLITHDGMSLGAVSHPHPVLGNINGYQWFAFVGAHEVRHAGQIREAGAALENS